jgi:hypothetical protein
VRDQVRRAPRRRQRWYTVNLSDCVKCEVGDRMCTSVEGAETGGLKAADICGAGGDAGEKTADTPV